MAVLSALYIYPIKSCRGLSAQHWPLVETGLRYDREWMLVDEDGECLTQRVCARMALIQTEIRLDCLRVQAPGMLRLEIALEPPSDPTAPLRRVHIWDDWVWAEDQGDLCAHWFSRFLERACRLVRCPPQSRRLAAMEWTGGLSVPYHFADAFPLLLISQASLDDLNHRLSQKGVAPVPMARFRPNLVIDGVEAYEEDYCQALRLGEVCLTIAKPCSRCNVPNIDIPTAQEGVEPGATLQTYRANARLGGAICFGQNAMVSSGAPSTLSLGETWEVELAFL